LKLQQEHPNTLLLPTADILFAQLAHIFRTAAYHEDVKSGVPTDTSTTLRLPAADVGRPVIGLFNEERIVARTWPAAENRIAVAELTY